ncbi:glycosyl hydrolase 115 family protein [Sphingobacterium sp. SGR-19]|uniref:glycosyl hydrolase 115 family protein n=1 Tax=Sphingobacterium sp. SGR-19 TaxID=2710886 RepID=UPI0019CF6637|nr:glycosyl hydrolase 115 family protein [Sphingobacterium sp. SGR-19]
MMMKRVIGMFFLLFIAFSNYAQDGFKLIADGEGASLHYSGTASLVETAIDLIVEDSKSVSEQPFRLTDKPANGSVIIGIPGESKSFDQLLAANQIDISEIKGQWEAFHIQAITDGNTQYLFVVGSDPHGAAYGVLELSRLIGVSPWVWWADVAPERKSDVILPADFKDTQYPNVQYRGIFLNDEDWGLTPWSAHTFEREAKIKEGIDPAKTKKMQTIGPKTYSKIFELLLRLRANTIWPAMHEVTVPFYFVQGNREAAEKYGIYIGSSHCEPLARNSATEWDIVGKGRYNYISNKENVVSYWTDRLKELGGSNNIFTLGMRGKHDGAMEGVKGVAEYKDAIDKVIVDQTALLKTYINPDPSQIPQVVIPYKEILDVYRAGMKVPDYATLMWCDDNYGYITHFPDAEEKQRSGGNGVYYHISYWGRPHDYLWLSTASPALIHQQLKTAYEHDVRKIWIVNVGDIKPGEYQTELFLDMAWNIAEINNKGVNQHLRDWLTREFGRETGEKLLPMMQEHYRLAHIRKPEFMGNTREEEADRAYYRTVRDLPWSEEEVRDLLQSYRDLSTAVSAIENFIPQNKREAFFQLIAYPIQGAAEMNHKMLHAQLARHGKVDWKESHDAFDRIIALTDKYNNLHGGKWNRMMDYKPRNLPVFQRVKEEQATEPMISHIKPNLTLNGADLHGKSTSLEGLGYEGKAVSVAKGEELYYDLKEIQGDSVLVEVRLLPSHPVEGGDIRFAISLGDTATQEISYKTAGRSEEWKMNVLRNQAIRKIRFPLQGKDKARIRISALDEGVVLDQVLVFGL